MTVKDAAKLVLEASNKPLNVKQITQKILVIRYFWWVRLNWVFMNRG
jgi:hypothetical protein